MHARCVWHTPETSWGAEGKDIDLHEQPGASVTLPAAKPTLAYLATEDVGERMQYAAQFLDSDHVRDWRRVVLTGQALDSSDNARCQVCLQCPVSGPDAAHAPAE